MQSPFAVYFENHCFCTYLFIYKSWAKADLTERKKSKAGVILQIAIV